MAFKSKPRIFKVNLKIKVMLSQVKNKEIKILAIIGLFVAFSFTGLFGLAFMAGCLVGEILMDIL